MSERRGLLRKIRDESTGRGLFRGVLSFGGDDFGDEDFDSGGKLSSSLGDDHIGGVDLSGGEDLAGVVDEDLFFVDKEDLAFVEEADMEETFEDD